MAVSWGTDTISLVAATGTAQYVFVTVDSNGKAAVPAGAGDFALGVTQNAVSATEATAGVPLQVKFTGGTKIRLAATSMAAGAAIASSTNGVAITLGAATTANRLAIALESGAASSIVSAILIGPWSGSN